MDEKLGETVHAKDIESQKPEFSVILVIFHRINRYNGYHYFELEKKWGCQSTLKSS